jgi:2-furoyl-CoA dehydrogenase large subunit
VTIKKKSPTKRPTKQPAHAAREQRAREAAKVPTNGPRWVGQPLQRKEEGRLLRGRGKFIDDTRAAGMLYLRLVRSPYAHARITKVDVSQAEAFPGVVCTLTGEEVAKLCPPFFEIGPEPGCKIVDHAMAATKVRYQGEPVVAVVAETRYAAEDAAELVQVEYDALDAVVDAETALADKSILHESSGTNLVWRGVFEYGDVEKSFREAAHVVSIDHLHCHRFSSTPLENNAIIAHWDNKEERLYFWCNNSFPTFGIQFLAPALGLRIDQIRVVTHDIGGSFGIKITNYPYMAICALERAHLS